MGRMKALPPAFALFALCIGCGDGNDSSARDASAHDAAHDAGALDAVTVGDGSARDASADGEAVDGSASSGKADATVADGGASSVRLPPLNGGLDYQLGGAYPPDSKVTIVSRDREDKPQSGLYNICYVNGFQTQPGEKAFWLEAQRADLVLRNSAGQPVIDPGWPDEMLLDIRSAEKRTRLLEIVGAWIDKCASDGFDAVEVDNLDTYSRQSSLPAAQRSTQQHAVTFIRMLTDRAHARGLAIGQKNSSELVARRTEMGTDFVVAEECQQYDECQDYKAGYGDQVLVIEYQKAAFDEACKAYPELPIVLRDVAVSPKGAKGYVFSGC